MSAVARVQAWLADEREAGRCVLSVSDAWVAQLLDAAKEPPSLTCGACGRLRAEAEYGSCPMGGCPCGGDL